VFETGGLVDELKKRLAERMPASWKERGRVALAVKPIYQAESAAAARERLEDFDRGPWGQKYPAIAQSWRRNWKQAISVLRLRA
jgi:transposase-like protein